MNANSSQNWSMQLYQGSPLKQQKWKALHSIVGETAGQSCLDIGSDNGVISYLFRRQGGRWKSADLDLRAVETTRRLVQRDVYQIDGITTPFESDEFDQVVIVDFLEHIEDDRAFIKELYRVLKPQGNLIVNVPHWQSGIIRAIRETLNQGDAAHGHVRPGYSMAALEELLKGHFLIEEHLYYSGLFGHLFDTLLAFGFSLVRRAVPGAARKGNIVTDRDLQHHSGLFRLYRLLTPLATLINWLDERTFVASDHMLVVRASSSKPVGPNSRRPTG